MATKARGHPRGMAAIASHSAIVVCKRTYVAASPSCAVFLDRFCKPCLLIVVRVSGCNRILYLNDLPFFALFNHGTLKETVILRVELPLAPGCAKQLQVRSSFGRCRPRRHERSVGGDAAVAIDAVDLNCVSRLSIQLSIPVTILGEMTVNAMHSLFQVNVLQMHCPPEFVRIIGRNYIVLLIEQIALAVLLVNRPENPAMTMEVRKLRVL